MTSISYLDDDYKLYGIDCIYPRSYIPDEESYDDGEKM